jgi:hypothetical protein
MTQKYSVTTWIIFDRTKRFNKYKDLQIECYQNVITMEDGSANTCPRPTAKGKCANESHPGVITRD